MRFFPLIRNSSGRRVPCLIQGTTAEAAAAVILRAQLPSQAKQTNKRGEDDSADIFATPGRSAASNFDGDEAFLPPEGGFRWSKWIIKVYKSTSQPSDCSLCSAALSSAKCREVFLFFPSVSPLSFFFSQTNVLEAGNKASRTDYCAAAPHRQSKLCLAS